MTPDFPELLCLDSWGELQTPGAISVLSGSLHLGLGLKLSVALEAHKIVTVKVKAFGRPSVLLAALYLAKFCQHKTLIELQKFSVKTLVTDLKLPPEQHSSALLTQAVLSELILKIKSLAIP